MLAEVLRLVGEALFQAGLMFETTTLLHALLHPVPGLAGARLAFSSPMTAVTVTADSVRLSSLECEGKDCPFGVHSINFSDLSPSLSQSRSWRHAVAG